MTKTSLYFYPEPLISSYILGTYCHAKQLVLERHDIIGSFPPGLATAPSHHDPPSDERAPDRLPVGPPHPHHPHHRLHRRRHTLRLHMPHPPRPEGAKQLRGHPEQLQDAVGDGVAAGGDVHPGSSWDPGRPFQGGGSR